VRESDGIALSAFHSHVFLGKGHERSERKTWAVIWLYGTMMIAEIVGGLLFGWDRACCRRSAYELAGALLLAARLHLCPQPCR
jgi:hypothetical protein